MKKTMNNRAVKCVNENKHEQCACSNTVETSIAHNQVSYTFPASIKALSAAKNIDSSHWPSSFLINQRKNWFLKEWMLLLAVQRFHYTIWLHSGVARVLSTQGQN